MVNASNKEGKEYGKRGKVGQYPPVILADTGNTPKYNSVDYMHPLREIYNMEEYRDIPPEGSWYGSVKPKSLQDTPNKQKVSDWLRRTYQPMASRPLSGEDIPDIATGDPIVDVGSDAGPAYSKGYFQPFGANRTFVGVQDDEGDIDPQNPEERALAFHETGHALTGLKDSSTPAESRYVPFYQGNASSTNAKNMLEARGERSMQPFDTTYTTLKDKLDNEALDRQRALREQGPNIVDKALAFFTGNKANTSPPLPSSYFNADKMRQQMKTDNINAIDEADKRAQNNNNLRTKALQSFTGR